MMLLLLFFLQSFEAMEITGLDDGDSVADSVNFAVQGHWTPDDFIGLEIFVNGETAAYFENPPFKGIINFRKVEEGDVQIRFVASFFGGRQEQRIIHIHLLKNIFKERVHLIQIPVIMNSAFRELAPSQFRVRLSGTPLEVSMIRGIESPLDLVILLDTSSSMTDRLALMRIMISDLIKQLQDQDRVKIIGFSDQVYQISDFTTDRNALRKSMLCVKVNGYTNLYGALWAGIKSLEKVERRRAIILLTDGKQQLDQHGATLQKTLDECLVMGRQEMTPVYVMGMGMGSDPEVLSRIAEGTCGRFCHSVKRKKIKTEFQAFLSDLRRQVVLCLYNPGELKGWQNVQIDFLQEDPVRYPRNLYLKE
jgi:hypothetical protein